VGLVDDEGVIFVEPAIPLNLRQQHAIGHQLDMTLGTDPVMEPYLVTDAGSQLPPQLIGYPGSQTAGGDAPRLCVTDPAVDPPPQGETDLGKLRGLAGAGLTTEDNHLVLRDQPGDLLPLFADRQLRRKPGIWQLLAPASGE